MISGGCDGIIEARKACDDVRATVVELPLEGRARVIGRSI